jgi:hypothetical protein
MVWGFLLLVLLRGVDGIISNITVDDENGDEVTGAKPSFSPNDAWLQGAGCNGCAATPSLAFAFDRTWHDATYILGIGDPEPRVMSYTFSGAYRFHLANRSYLSKTLGTAIYVYCILANTIPTQSVSGTHLTFTLDGQNAGDFVHTPDNTTNYLYNVPVYANPSLSNGQHSFTFEMVNPSLVLFDYLVYS